MRRLLLLGLLWAGTVQAEVPPGLLVRFTCDTFRAAGELLLDTSGNKNNGHVTHVRWTREGRLAGGCEFTGKNSFVDVPLPPGSPSGTVCLWFRTLTDHAEEQVLLDSGSGYTVCVVGNSAPPAEKGRLRVTLAGRECFSEVTVNDRAWHHAAIICDVTHLSVAVDGVSQKQGVEWHDKTPESKRSLRFGKSLSESSSKAQERGFVGIMDEVMIFSKA